MKVDPLQILAKLSALYNIPVNRVTPPFEGLENFDYGLRKALDPEFDWQEFGYTLLKQTPEKTFLIAEGTFELKFALFHVPDEVDTVLMIGPWTTGPRSEKARQWAKKHLGEAGNAAVQEYYNGVRVLQSDGFTAALYAVASVMMSDGDTLQIKSVKEFLPFMFYPDTRYFTEPAFERDIPVAMIEQRYQAENELLEAVTRGDETAAMLCIHQYSRFSLGDRFIGTLYREKSQFIIMNTLLRKAIEQNAVHPFYVDKLSSHYAHSIEELDTVEDINAMAQQMVQDYCAYARRYSLKGYSPTVQKVINHINLNLSEPHTLKSLAALCHISPSYLSALFKQETGTTLIDYINTQRVKRAAQLLTTTERSISEVAEEMGILDVNYFAKIFKRSFGMTPTRYRRENRKK